jgi:hypothetical protein
MAVSLFVAKTFLAAASCKFVCIVPSSFEIVLLTRSEICGTFPLRLFIAGIDLDW